MQRNRAGGSPLPTWKLRLPPDAFKMVTSLGSNTYNRQNWEDAVSEPAGGEQKEAAKSGLQRAGRDVAAVRPREFQEEASTAA